MVQLNWETPYPSNRSPVFARNIVASSQPLAVDAGINAMRKGGNAVDAALATAIALTVVEPNNNGIGSDAFALIHDGENLHGLNASGRSPAGLTAEKLKHHAEMPKWGWDAVTVPGAVSAWVAMSERFGRLEFTELFVDAIRHAERGYQVGPKTGSFWPYAIKHFADYEAFQATFGIDGRAPAIGEVMRLPDHAKSLARIAETKGQAFYGGELAEAMVQDSDRHGGYLSMEDLSSHSADWVEPLSMNAFGAELHEIPPNGQGLMALISLGILKHRFTDQGADSVEGIHLQIEAQRIAYAEAERHLADPDAMTVPVDALLDPAYLEKRAAEIDPAKANPNPVTLGSSEDTVYLTAADENGMMVSMIQSNYRGFGSGIVIPGTGISMQNRGSGFTLEKGHPNQAGPSKRPYHTIIPGFVTAGGLPVMSFGVMGGHMQAQGHLQMMIRVMHHGQNPQAALDAPRWHVFEDGRVALEYGFDSDIIEGLLSRGHDIVQGSAEHLFGGGQLIVRMKEGYCAGSDHRKEGLAAGF